LKQICEDIATVFAAAFPAAFKNNCDRCWKAKKAEVSAATMASSSHTGPRPEGTQEEGGEHVARLDALTVVKGADKVQAYQLLSDSTASVSRYFVCRNPDCSPEGAFCSLNMFWMSTAFGADGKAHSGTGWSWACPNCGRIYNPKSTQVPYHMAFYCKTKGAFLLSAWPATLDESALTAMKEQTAGIGDEWNQKSASDIMEKIVDMTEQFAVPAEMRPFSITPAAIVAIEWVNEKRREGAGRRAAHQYHRTHIPSEFPAAFIPYVAGRTPVMSEEDTKRLVQGSFKYADLQAGGQA
jgi:hypothetical protein